MSEVVAHELKAVAYYSWGRWVVDCPNPDCTNAIQLEPGHTQFLCWTKQGIGPHSGACGTVAPIQWPDDMMAVETTLNGRAPSQQHWKPGDQL